MKILLISDFRGDSVDFRLNPSRMFAKGFLRNGHDVLNFSYREMLLRQSPVLSKKWAVRLAKGRTDRLLVELLRDYQPDLVFVGSFRLLDSETIQRAKEVAPRATFLCWYQDMLRAPDPRVSAIALSCDWFLSTGGGAILRDYKSLGVSRCAFMPNPSDPDVEGPRSVEDRWKSELLFTGTLKHGRGQQDPLRAEILRRLLEDKRLTLYGGLERPRLKGSDYLNAICGAQSTLSINAYNHVRFYHSDRLTHYLACGAFVIAKRVPDSEFLFEDELHLRYFDTLEECLSLVERYEIDSFERRAMAERGLERARKAFNCTRLAGYVMDLVKDGKFDEPWCDVV